MMPGLTAEQVYEAWKESQHIWSKEVYYRPRDQFGVPAAFAADHNALSPRSAAALIRDAVARWLHGHGVWIMPRADDDFAIDEMKKLRIPLPHYPTYDEALRAAAREVRK